MYHEYNEETLRAYCRTGIEALEKWARLIIDRELTIEYGHNYFDSKMENDDPVVKKEINDKATNMMMKHPDRFKRKIDTLFLDEIIYLLCKVQLYKKVFKKVLDEIYPDGHAEARTYLNRLVPIRNKLSHSNPISIREAERAICYSHDFIDGVKSYFAKIGETQMYNVPQAIKLSDSFGGEYILENKDILETIKIVDENKTLRMINVGDRVSFRLTMDPSFQEDSYEISWQVKDGVCLKGKEITCDITEDMVGTNHHIICCINQNKKWHKYGFVDQRFIVVIQVLPPE